MVVDSNLPGYNMVNINLYSALCTFSIIPPSASQFEDKMLKTSGGFAVHLKNFLSSEEVEEIRKILDDLEFPEPGTFMGHRIPRQCLWFGPGKYKFGGRNYYPEKPIEELTELGNKLAERTRPLLESAGLQSKLPEALLVNKYSKKTDSVSEHQDDEPSLGKNPTILSLSIGQTRKFLIRPTKKPGIRRKASDNTTWILKSGDLVVLAGDVQDFYTHELRKGKVDGVRYNLTYRPYVDISKK
jgi:alkylated DNA repair dioxygenase AlkB